jgi:hypothetical protein
MTYMKLPHTINRYILATLVSLAFLFSCSDDDFEQATITFYPTLAGVANEPDAGKTGTPTTISVQTSRVLDTDSQVNIRVKGNGGGYGTSYVTFPPQLEPGIVTLTIPRGENGASFTFTPRNDGVVEQHDYQYTFSIEQTSNAIRSVGQKVFTLKVLEGRFRFFNFASCSGIPTGFTERIVPGTGVMTASTWACTSFGFPNDTPNAIEANAFGKGEGASNSYLVLDVIDGNQYNSFYIDFEVYSRFSGAGIVKMVYSTNYSGTGNPEATGVVWNELTEMNTQFPAAGSRVWKHVTGSLLDVNGSNIYLAFQFVGGTAASSANWRIDDIVIKAE